MALGGDALGGGRVEPVAQVEVAIGLASSEPGLGEMLAQER